MLGVLEGEFVIFDKYFFPDFIVGSIDIPQMSDLRDRVDLPATLFVGGQIGQKSTDEVEPICKGGIVNKFAIMLRFWKGYPNVRFEQLGDDIVNFGFSFGRGVLTH